MKGIGSNKSGSHRVAVLAIVWMLSLGLVTAWAAPPADDEADIRKLVDRISDGWQKADSDAVARVFAEDGVLVAGEGSRRNGRAEIAHFMNQVFAGMPKGMRLTTQFKSLRFLRPDVAMLHTEGGFLMPGETQLPPERLGIQSFIATKQAGAWHVALFQDTRIQTQDYESR